MSREPFYALYRKLAAGRNEPTKAFTALDEFAQLCGERRTAASSPDEWLGEADDCLHEITQSSPLFAEAVSRWLANDDDIALAKALVHKASVRHLQQPAAEAYDLSDVEEGRSILVGCRLCALNAAPAVSLGWTLSLAVSYPASDKASRAVEHLLQYHVDELPRSTRRLLSFEGSPFESVEISNATLVALNEREAWLRRQPKLREFAMTPEMRLTLSGLKRSENRAILRSSREKSVLSQFFTTQHFKYANKTAVEFVVGDQVQETTLEMSSYGLSVELPLSEQTDPVAGADRRRSLWPGVPQ